MKHTQRCSCGATLTIESSDWELCVQAAEAFAEKHRGCPVQSASTQPRRLAVPADKGLADYINGGHGDLRETEYHMKAWRHA